MITLCIKHVSINNSHSDHFTLDRYVHEHFMHITYELAVKKVTPTFCLYAVITGMQFS